MTSQLKINLKPRHDLVSIVFFVLFATAILIAFSFNPVYGLAAVGVSALVMVFAKWPQVGIYLMVLLFPYINLQFFIGQQINIPYVDALAMLVFLAWIVRTIWIWANGGGFIKLKDLPGIGFFLLFIGASLLSLYNSTDWFLSLKFVLRPLAFFYLMFVVLPFNTITSKEILKKVLWCFWATGMFIAVTGAASILLIQRTDFFRVIPIAIFGIYPLGTNQNLIAESLVVILPFVAMLAMMAKNETRRKFIVLSLVFMGAIALGTLSRAGLLSIILELTIFIFYYYRKNLRAVLPAVLLGLVVSLPLVYYLSAFFSSDISKEATENRLLLTRIAWDAFKQHPIIGNGAGLYTHLVEINRTYIRLFGNPLDSHGVIQKLLAESGIVGLVTFVALALYVLWRTIRPFKTVVGERARKILLACVIVVTAGFFFQLFNTSYYVSKLWLPVGVALAAVRLVEEKKVFT